VASCLSSIRRSIDRNCSGAGDDRGVAREGRHDKQATGAKTFLTNLPLLLGSGADRPPRSIPLISLMNFHPS
jgi:hypothetical protein